VHARLHYVSEEQGIRNACLSEFGASWCICSRTNGDICSIFMFSYSFTIYAVLLGECWPGSVAFPDFLNEKTRNWWAKLVKEFVAVGVDGIWNDMNEPAVFKVRIKFPPKLH
jgi:hypothetical protein